MNREQGFAVWITGMPASGKSSITRELIKQLKVRDIPAVTLESDEMRRILTPDPTYDPEERDRFYRMLVLLGAMIAQQGGNVIFDATAARRRYRDQARALIPKFLEAFVQCPLDVCMQRDPKGIYHKAATGQATTVPGLQAPYETPLNPELSLDGREAPDANADMILSALRALGYI